MTSGSPPRSPTNTTGPTLGLNNVVTVATGAGSGQYANSVVALDPKTLGVLGWFTGAAPFTTSPVAFNYGGRDVVAVAANDGRMYLLDGAMPGGAESQRRIWCSIPSGRRAWL